MAGKQAQDGSTWSAAGEAKAKRRRRRVLLIVSGVALGGLALIIALAPTIASGFVPGIVSSKGSEAIAGSVEMRSASLSWFGPQRLRSVRVVDTDGSNVADVDVDVSAGLIGLAFGGLDIGEVTLRGRADVRKSADGTLNITRALASSSPAGSSGGGSGGGGSGGSGAPGGTSTTTGGGVPATLKAAVVLDGVSITYADPAIEQAGLKSVGIASARGRATIDGSNPLSVSLDVPLSAEQASGSAEKAGSIKIEGTVTGLFAPDGAIDAPAATIVAKVTLDGVDGKVVDRVLDVPMDVAQALGSALSATLEASGSLLSPSVSLDARSKHVRAAGAVKFEDDVLVLSEAFGLTLTKEAFEAIDPAWLAEASGNTLEVGLMPSVDVSVTSLRVPLSGVLASASAEAAVKVSALEATVTIQDQPQQRRRVSTEPASVRVVVPTLAEGGRVQADVSFLVDGKAAGDVAVDLTASDVLDEQGKVRTDGLPTMRGRAGIAGIDTAVLEPFVAAAGLNMLEEIGPTLSLEGVIGPHAEAATRFDGMVESQNVNGSIHLILDGTRLTADDPAGELRVGSIGPLMTRKLSDAGVAVTNGASLAMYLQHLVADLSPLMKGEAFGPQHLAARAEVGVGQTAGQVQVDGRGIPFELEQIGSLVDFDGATNSARVRVVSAGMFDGQPAGSANIALRLDGVFGSGWSPGVPSGIQGRAELMQVAAALAEPLLRARGLEASDVIGSTLDLVIEASPMDGRATRVVVSGSSEQLSVDGALILQDTLLTVDQASPLTMTHAGLGAVLASMVDLGQAASINPSGGAIEFSMSRLLLPLDATTRAPRLDQVDWTSRLEVRDVGVRLEGVESADQPALRQIVLNTRMRPEQGLTGDVRTIVLNRRQQIRGSGSFEAPGMPQALAGGSWELEGLKPKGTFSIPEVSAALVADLISMANIEGLDAGALATDLVGASVALEVGVDSTPLTAATLKITGERLNASASASMPQGVPEAEFSTEARLLASSVQTLMKAFLPDMAESVRNRGDNIFRVRGALRKGRDVEASLTTSSLVFDGIDAKPVRIALNGRANTQLPEADATPSARPLSLNLKTTFETIDRAPIGELTADMSTTVGGEVPGALTGSVVASGLRTSWADALLGTIDLYQGALGETVGVQASAQVDPSTQATKISAQLQAPTLSSISPIEATMREGALLLDKPFRATWRGDNAWLSARMARTLGDKAPSIDQPITLDLDVRGFRLPPSDRAMEGVVPTVELVARLPRLDLTMPGGERRSFRQFQINASTNKPGTELTAEILADVQLAGVEAAKAIDVRAQVKNLSRDGVLTPASASLDATGTIRHFPTSLVDALSGMNGWLVEMLGQELAGDMRAERVPLEGGTISLDARTPTAQAKVSGTFRDIAPAGQAQTGALVVDGGSFFQLSSFQESFSKRIFNVVPIFGSVQKAEGEQQPARIDIVSARVPMSGDVQQLAFALKAAPGSLRYTIGGPIESALKLTGQRSLGEIGGNIAAFDVAMSKGILTYDNLNIPLGEFSFANKGSIDTITQQKDLLILMPAGAFAVDAFGISGMAKDLINDKVLVPMSNKGPMNSNTWKPDFGAARGELFKPEGLIDDAVKKGIQELFKRPRDGGGGGGG